VTESSRKPSGGSHPRAAVPDDLPARLSLDELRAIFPDWTVQQLAGAACTATRKSGASTRVVGADSPAELAAAILRIEREEDRW